MRENSRMILPRVGNSRSGLEVVRMVDIHVGYMGQVWTFLLVFVLLQIMCDAFPSSDRQHHLPAPVMACDPRNSTCPEDFCCVKKVITYADVSRHALGYTECQQLRKFRQFCLVSSGGFMCPCGKGLTCVTKHRENFGHCDKGVD